MASLTKLIERMRHYCAVASVGYDQSNRWDVRDGGETDCSALVITCLREAGFDVGSATFTGNMSANLTRRGWARISPDGHPRAGDILLNDRHHVAVCLGGGRLAQASIDENGNATGGRPGDQTGRETNITTYYDYPWDCYLRYTGESEDDDMATPGDIWGYDYKGSAPGGNMYNAICFELPGRVARAIAQCDYKGSAPGGNLYNAICFEIPGMLKQLTKTVEAQQKRISELSEKIDQLQGDVK